MKTDFSEDVYHRMNSQRDAISRHYLKNTTLKTDDPIRYQQCQKELREINKRLRVIRQYVPANPTLGAEPRS